MIPSPQEIIDAHLEWMRAGGFASNTIDDAARLLRVANRSLPAGLCAALSEELASFLAGPPEGWSPQTRATYRQHIMRFFIWACDEDDPWLTVNPARRLRRPRVAKPVPRPATDDQVRAGIMLPMPWRLHVRLAAYAGLRCMEIAQLCREDLDERDIRIRHGKGYKPAVVPMHRLIWEIAEGMEAGPVTRRPRGPATAHWVSNGTRLALRAAGTPVTMHRFRAWYVTMIQRVYRDATVTQRLARHESLATTQGYVLVADESARAAVAGLPDLSDR